MPNISDRELSRLRNSVQELTALNQIANAINVAISVEKITHIILDHCLNRVGASQGAIFLLEDDEDTENRFKTIVREIRPISGQFPLRLNMGLTGWMIKNKKILLSNDPAGDERFRGMNMSALKIRSLLAAPLLSRNGMIGVLAVFNKSDEAGFDDTDRRFLGIVGTQTAKVIENAQLMEKDRELVGIRNELKVAEAIQRRFLPSTNLATEAYEVFGFNEPAAEVGGDYYDMVELEGGRVFVSLGDVSGKGMPAALLMSNAQAVLRSQVSHGGDISLTELAENLNRLICLFTPPQHFITALFGIYDSVNHELEFINAGHCPPVILRASGELELPSESDLIIGVVPGYSYTAHRISLEKGESVFIYTDGITEAFNEEEQEFGEERLEKILRENHQLLADEIGHKVYSEVVSFRGKREQSDDITMLILRRP